MTDKQPAGLAKSSQKKKLSAIARTKRAIAKLVESKQKITIRSVAREAGVSVSYIYKYPELAYQIQTLREQQKYGLIEAKKRVLDKPVNLTDLEQDNLKLRQEIASLKLYIAKRGKQSNSQSNLQQENIQLLTENQQLKRELEYTQQKLQEARDFILDRGQDNSGASELEFKTEAVIVQKVRKIKQM